MKWTQLRLNMLPITAVQIQYAGQSLIKLHNKIIDIKNTLNSMNINDIPKPNFVASYNFLPKESEQKKKINLNKNILEQYQIQLKNCLCEYDTLKKQIQRQINQLDKFYVKNCHDSSASLFHMLKLKLQRKLFDCNSEMNRNKKVPSKEEQQNQYKTYLQKFQSNPSNNNLNSNIKNNSTTNVNKISAINNPMSQMKIKESSQNKLQSRSTFKTLTIDQSYDNQISENEFLDFQNQQEYQKLNFDLTSDRNIKTQKLYSTSAVFNKKSIKHQPGTNTIKQKNPSNMQIQQNKIINKQTIGYKSMANNNNQSIINSKVRRSPKNLSSIINSKQTYKNVKNIPKTQSFINIQRKAYQVNSTNQNNQLLSIKNTKNKQIYKQSQQATARQNKNTYSQLNQKKKSNVTTINNPSKSREKQPQVNLYASKSKEKNVRPIYNLKNQSLQRIVPKSTNPPKKTNFNLSKNQVNTLQERSKINSKYNDQQLIQQRKSLLNKPKIDKNIKIETTNPQIDINKMAQALTDNNENQLRFTIKMSKEQYKSLLQMKSKMSSKPIK